MKSKIVLLNTIIGALASLDSVMSGLTRPLRADGSIHWSRKDDSGDPTIGEVKSAVAALGSAFEEFKNENEKNLKEFKGQIPSDIQEKMDKIQEDLDKKSALLDGLQTAMNRGGQKQIEDEDGQKGHVASGEYKEMADKYLRRGVKDHNLIDNENFIKQMSVDSDPDGGIWVNPEMEQGIIRDLVETTPMRQLARVRTIGSDALELMRRRTRMNSGWVGETKKREGTNNPTLGKLRIPVHELYAEPCATQKLLEDSAVNVEAFLAEEMLEEFSLQENTAFILGDGIDKPRGILTYADDPNAQGGDDKIQQVQSGTNGDFDFDDLISLMCELKTPYLGNSSWLMARRTLHHIRTLKDNDGQYLWQPSLQLGNANSILGRPYVLGEDMPDYTVAGAKAVAFGDFNRAYTIVDRRGMRTIRDEVTCKPFVLFYTTKRVGGGLVQGEAVKILTTES